MAKNLTTYRSIDDPKVSQFSFIPQIFSSIRQINTVIMSRTSVFTNKQALLANLLGSRLCMQINTCDHLSSKPKINTAVIYSS